MAVEVVESVIELSREVLSVGMNMTNRDKPGCRWRSVFLVFITAPSAAVTYWLFI